jgi:hypothetical protein
MGTWVFRFKLNGRIREMDVGPVSRVSLGEARKLVAEIQIPRAKTVKLTAGKAFKDAVNRTRERANAADRRQAGGPIWEPVDAPPRYRMRLVRVIAQAGGQRVMIESLDTTNNDLPDQYRLVPLGTAVSHRHIRPNTGSQSTHRAAR